MLDQISHIGNGTRAMSQCIIRPVNDLSGLSVARGRSAAGRLPSAVRLRALMDVLGYSKHGDDKRFAQDCGFGQPALSQYLSSRPLPWAAVLQIVRRFHPRVSADFLMLGLGGGNLDRAVEEGLRKWEREHAVEVFVRPR